MKTNVTTSNESFNYYNEQLNKLDKESIFGCIKITDGIGNETKYMHLNDESIKACIHFLKTKLK